MRFTLILAFLVFSVAALAVDAEKRPCGLSGSISERIKDCSYIKGNFILVTRTEKSHEVYRETDASVIWGDEAPLLWSDRLPVKMYFANASYACRSDLDEVGDITEVSWRLPRKEELELANRNGIRTSLPNMDSMFWSSSMADWDSRSAWYLDGNSGFISRVFFDLRFSLSVRCVASTRF